MELRPNARRAKTAIIFVWAVLGFDILLTVFNYLQWQLYRGIKRGIATDFDAIHNGDTRIAATQVLYVMVYIASVVAFLRWFRRAFYNLEMLSPKLKFGNADTIWPWFVPVVNLFVPMQVMSEMHSRTADYLNEKGTRVKVATNVILIWWTLWILKIFSGQVSIALSARATSVGKLVTASGFATASAVISIPLALMAILVIQNYSEMEQALSTTDAASENQIKNHE